MKRQDTMISESGATLTVSGKTYRVYSRTRLPTETPPQRSVETGYPGDWAPAPRAAWVYVAIGQQDGKTYRIVVRAFPSNVQTEDYPVEVNPGYDGTDIARGPVVRFVSGAYYTTDDTPATLSLGRAKHWPTSAIVAYATIAEAKDIDEWKRHDKQASGNGPRMSAGAENRQ